jgi:hypothetical protein
VPIIRGAVAEPKRSTAAAETLSTLKVEPEAAVRWYKIIRSYKSPMKALKFAQQRTALVVKVSALRPSPLLDKPYAQGTRRRDSSHVEKGDRQDVQK